MEVVSVAKVPPGCSPQSDYRESLIESILTKPYLIYGAEVCRICVRVKPFHGWAGAMGAHQGNDRSFLCRDCRTGHRTRPRGTGGPACEVCLRRDGLEKVDGGDKRLCSGCREQLEREYSDTTAGEVLGRLSRRRHLELRSTESLETLDFNTEVQRVEEIEQRERDRLRDRRFEQRAADALSVRHARVVRGPDGVDT
jgi:hypothetical protein